jgi:plastocyanin
MRRECCLPVVAALLLGTMAAPAQAETIQITTTDLVFASAEVSAKVGDTIEWINKDVLAHTDTRPCRQDRSAITVTIHPSARRSTAPFPCAC